MLREHRVELAGVPALLPSLPSIGVPCQDWELSSKAVANPAIAPERAGTQRTGGTQRTERERMQGTISTGHRPPTVTELSQQFRTEFWPWIVVALLSGGASLAFGSTLPLSLAWGVEALFWGYCKVQHLTFDRVNPPEPMKRDVVELWRMCLTNVPCARGFLQGWFYDAPFEDITRDDVKDFLAWALYSSTFPKLAANDVRDLAKVFALIELECDVRFPRRRQGQAPLGSMRFSIEPVQYHHKPLLFYMSTRFILGSLGSMNLVDSGFSHHNAGALNYWVRMPESEEARARLPIVFVHGVGVGLVTYMGFVRKLIANDCPILCLELPFVSMSLDAKVPSIDQQVASVRAMLDREGFDAATFVGHSYGSVMLSWMVQHAPERVASVVFIDPIVIMLNLKSTLYNFLYRHSTNGKISDLVGSELFLNHALRRHFWWYRNIIWAQDMHDEGIPSMVIVSENDEIVPSAEVAQHIQDFDRRMEGRSLVKHVTIEDGSHGDMLFDDEVQDRVLALVSQTWAEADRARSEGTVPLQKRVRRLESMLRRVRMPIMSLMKSKVQRRVARQLYKKSSQVAMQLAAGRWRTHTLERPAKGGGRLVSSSR